MSETSPLTGRALSREGTPRTITRPAPTLRGIYRGGAPDELILLGTDGRCVLLKGDGLTQEEAVWMREAAISLLGGTNEPQPAAGFFGSR
jgi:hypothetical protein